MPNVYEIRIRATGDMATVLEYQPSSSHAFRVRLPSGRAEWLKQIDVDMFEPVPPGYKYDDRAVQEEAPAQTGLQEPLLTGGRNRGGSAACAYLQVVIGVILTIGTVLLAIDRNSHCDPEDLQGVEPPYDGNLLPFQFILSERKQYIQLSKMIDVYDENWVRIGYFYDLNLFLFMRFGYSDTSGRIWFEARRPSLLTRIFQLGKQYYLQRCDVGARGRHGGVFHLKEDFMQEPWFCFQNCLSIYNITRRSANREHAEGGDVQPIANAVFNSTLEWYHRGMITPSARHRWYMNLTDARDGSVVVLAKQRFRPWRRMFMQVLLSNWTVDISEDLPLLPNWVVGFMAALDDVDRADD
ncbi:Iigp1 [Symbiodinium natans]|uniref:Iigp1 protein n=1 Tax=Symbiodinium natans TaxID=878477 RepID=A0A812NM92_9DINO|nr:Iigp1 [Symbiodinium natans]